MIFLLPILLTLIYIGAGGPISYNRRQPTPAQKHTLAGTTIQRWEKYLLTIRQINQRLDIGEASPDALTIRVRKPAQI